MDDALPQFAPPQAVLYWFRADLRLHDNPAWTYACQNASAVVPVVCQPPAIKSLWGFDRVGAHRLNWQTRAVADMAQRLALAGVPLLHTTGLAVQVLPHLAQQLGITHIVCEAIAAPDELQEVAALEAAGLTVHSLWQSSLLNPPDLPFQVENLPAVFSDFRKAVEQAGVCPPAPLPVCMPAPIAGDLLARIWALKRTQAVAVTDAHAHFNEESEVAGASRLDTRSAFPYSAAPLGGGERAARAHVQQYLARQLPHTYKATRNGLMGVDYSSKWSPWLATGALSPRWAYAQLQQFEAAHGASDSSYWLWFELLWRDYFRFLHLQHASSPAKLRWLYRYQGLLADAAALPLHDDRPLLPQHKNRLQQWIQGNTGQPLVDAGMRELAATGYLSNRMRQIVASYWVHDLQGDWRIGAAWFESQLLDYDVYSNQGNWLYISGRGTDPRGGRRFNPMKQTQDHDPEGHYQRLWGTAT